MGIISRRFLYVSSLPWLANLLLQLTGKSINTLYKIVDVLYLHPQGTSGGVTVSKLD